MAADQVFVALFTAAITLGLVIVIIEIARSLFSPTNANRETRQYRTAVPVVDVQPRRPTSMHMVRGKPCKDDDCRYCNRRKKY